MSDVLVIDDGPARQKMLLKEALTRGAVIHEVAIDEAAAGDFIHETLYHCGVYKDFCNEMLDEIWPLLRAEIYFDYLNRHVATPIVEYSAIVHPTPWDWDIQACEGCGKMVGYPVMKNKNAWLGNKYCYACERQLLSQGS